MPPLFRKAAHSVAYYLGSFRGQQRLVHCRGVMVCAVEVDVLMDKDHPLTCREVS